MYKYALIVGGGSGTRMGADIPKQFLLLHGKPLLMHTIDTFIHAFSDLVVILVLPQAFLQQGEELMNGTIEANRYILVAGGDTRFQSVKNGLQHVPDQSVCFVHDAVRCLVSRQLIQRCYEVTRLKGNAVPSIAATDSLRMETGDGTSRVLERSKVRMIQTPQTFPGILLKKAFEQPYQASFTDEASVVENTGVEINLVEGELSNIKITTPIDLLLADHLLKQMGV